MFGHFTTLYMKGLTNFYNFTQITPWPTKNIRPCMLHNFEKNRRPKNERRE